jgi:hypothetical protein
MARKRERIATDVFSALRAKNVYVSSVTINYRYQIVIGMKDRLIYVLHNETIETEQNHL